MKTTKDVSTHLLSRQTCWFSFSFRNYWSFFHTRFLRKAYLACREVQSERRNDEESTSNWKTPAGMWTACTDSLQASLCTLPLAAGHTESFALEKSQSFMSFGRFQVRRRWRLLPSLMWITDACSIPALQTPAKLRKKSAWGLTTLKGKLCWMLWMGSAILQGASLSDAEPQKKARFHFSQL